MPRLVAITRQDYAGKSWNRYQAYHFASKDSLAPLTGAEAARAAVALPIAFIKQQDHFSLVAVLSLIPGVNMFVAPNGQWLGGYIPSVFRGYPFRLARAEGQENLILCVDEDSGLINNNAEGEPFFDDAGEISKPVKDVLDFLNQVEQNRIVTGAAVAGLAEAGVIGEWPLKIQDGDQERAVNGLYRIDESKLNSLEDEQFLKLRESQSFPIAYAQLLSMGNILMFSKLAKIKEQMSMKKPDVKGLLGDDDIISFE